MLAAVGEMRFSVSVLPGDTILEVNVLRMSEEAALVEGVAPVEHTVVTRGQLSCARMAA